VRLDNVPERGGSQTFRAQSKIGPKRFKGANYLQLSFVPISFQD